ncbi:MAG TPA: EVE domain-containing protein [Micromonosporaceae bacterium]|nr:EVE domain-containing protein [Micromonosporaceae bacterium]
MAGRVVSPDNLGAWLLKRNADRSDIAARSARPGHIDRWCVHPNYRTALMRPGQRMIFWASGSGRGHVPGIWGVGWIVGPAAHQPAAPDDLDPRLHVPVMVALLAEDHRIDRDALRADERLHDLEVFRMPQGSNPSFVSLPQLRVIEEYIAWPDPPSMPPG